MTSTARQDIAAIETVLREYTDLTNAHDAAGVATKSYRAPVLLVSDDGSHVAFPDTKALTAGFKAYLEGETKAGWVSNSIVKMEVRLLSNSVALAFVDYDKKQKTGHKPDGWVYMFQKKAGAWRAVSVAARDVHKD